MYSSKVAMESWSTLKNQQPLSLKAVTHLCLLDPVLIARDPLPLLLSVRLDGRDGLRATGERGRGRQCTCSRQSQYTCDKIPLSNLQKIHKAKRIF